MPDSLDAPTRAPNHQDPRVIRSRQALHKAFLELLEVKTLDEITIRDIADRSGVGYTTFFRHHPSKEAMLSEIVIEQIQRLLSPSMPVWDSGDLKAASTTIFAYVHEHRALWATLLTGGAAPLVREEFLRLSRDIAAARVPPSDWVPADIGLALIVSGTLELLTQWLRQSEPLSTKRIVEIYNRVIVSPILEANRVGMRTTEPAKGSTRPSKQRAPAKAPRKKKAAPAASRKRNK